MNSSLRHSTKRFDGLALSALLLLMCLVGAACSPGKSDAGSSGRPPAMAEIPQTFFYRIEADFILKETGEPIRFDYVVGCGGYVWNYSYTTSSKVSVRHPAYMYQSVPGGGALGIITIDMGDDWKWGNVRNVVDSPWAGKPHIPETVRPTVIWFDDANDLSHGWGYLTDDAYESPLAKIEFVKARITKSDKDAWKTWRDEAAATYEQVGMIPGPWGLTREALSTEEEKELDSRGVGRGIAGGRCSAASRVRLETEAIDRLFELAPKGTDEFWIPRASGSKFDAVQKSIWTLTIAGDAAHKVHDFGAAESSVSDFGSLSDDTLAHVHPYSKIENDGLLYREVFPLLPISAAMGSDLIKPQPVYCRKLLVGPEYKGFSYCSFPQMPADDLPNVQQKLDPKAYKKPVDLIVSSDGSAVKDHWGNVSGRSAPIMLSRSGFLYFKYD